MKLFIYSLLILLLFGCGGGQGKPDPILQACSVEINGDSIMVGPELAVPPVKRLRELHPDWIIEDKGVGGLSLNSLFTGYQTAWPGGPVPVIGPQPAFSTIVHTSRFVVIELGGNDAFSNQSPVVFEEQLRSVVSNIQTQNKIPVLTGIVQLTAAHTFDQGTVDRSIVLNAITRKVASDTGAVFAYWDEVYYAGLSDTIDEIHRTQPASDRLVAQLSKVLESECLKN